MEQYIIYKILNLINRKTYIGRTNNLIKRWKKHIADAKYDRKNGCTYLKNSMRKYGVENFEIKQIDKALNKKHQIVLENFYIKYYNSFDNKYGYNLMIDNYNDNSRLLSLDTKKKKCISMYKQNNTTKGVYWDKNRQKWKLRLKYLDIDIRKRFNSKEEAEKTYDKLALYLYKENAILHFPEDASLYSEDYLKDFYEKITFKQKPKRKNFGVYQNKNKKYSIYLSGIKPGRNVYGSFDNENNAAIIRDKILVFLGRDDLNFPELVTEKYAIEGAELYKKILAGFLKNPNSTSKYFGVVKKNNQIWEMSIGTRRHRLREYYAEETDAAKAYDYYLTNKFTNSSRKLNFPNEIISIKPISLTKPGKGQANSYRKKIQIVETGEIFESIKQMIKKRGSYIKAISSALKDSTKTVLGYHLIELSKE